FETASTPVIAAQPLENTFKSIHRLTIETAAGAAGIDSTGAGWPPERTDLITPSPIITALQPMNRDVGIMKATPAPGSPRRLTMVMINRMERQIGGVCGCRLGTAEMSAPTPAEIPTAAVRT